MSIYKCGIILLFFMISSIHIFAQHGSIQANHNSQLAFIENKNQWDSRVLYKADIPSGKLFLTNEKLTYVLYDSRFFARHHHSHDRGTSRIISEPTEDKMNMHVFDVSFKNANPHPSTNPAYPLSNKYNYFMGDDPAKWASEVNAYRRVSYTALYPNIDFTIYENSNSIKYDFIVNPGGDASQIIMSYKGADSVLIKNKQLHIFTSVYSIVENQPTAYQIINGKTINVPCAFKITNGTDVSFRLENGYNKNFPLIIDPQLIFSSYSGSTADNWGNSATFDDAGNLYSAGTSFQPGFPADGWVGAFQASFAGQHSNFGQGYGIGMDVALLKFNPTGTTLLATTYLGGWESEMPFSLFITPANELVILGVTSSNGTISPKFPVTAGAYQTNFGGGVDVAPVGGVRYRRGTDIFVAKMTNNMATLLASTFVGGSANDGLLTDFNFLTKNYGDHFRGEIITDQNNDIYVASHTSSSNIRRAGTPGYDTTANGNIDGFVFKMSSDLSTMLWATYIGGSSEDATFSIQVDKNKDVYVTGGTYSANLPTSPSAILPTYQNSGDGFAAHFYNTGDSLIACTYIGTSAYDHSYFIQLDSARNIYLLGQTRGAYPVTAGVYTNPNGGQFIHKLGNKLDTTYYSTVFGSGGNLPNISPTAFLINDCENIFVCGWGGGENAFDYGMGYTNNMPITPGAFRTTSPDQSDFYLMVLRKDADSLLYGTYIGDPGTQDHVDGGTSRFDKKGIVYAAVCGGCGGSSGFPTYPNPGAWSNTNNSYFYDPFYNAYFRNCNNAVFKFDLSALKADFDIDTATYCGYVNLTVQNKSIGGNTFDWQINGVTVSNSPTGYTFVIDSAGTYNLRLIATDLTTCIGKDSISKVINILPQPPININAHDTIMCKGDSIQLSVYYSPYYKYLWTPKAGLSNDTIYNPKASPGNTSLYYITVTDTNGCESKDSLLIKVAIITEGINYENLSDCQGPPVVAFWNLSTGPLNYYWNFGDGMSSSLPVDTHRYTSYNTYLVTLDIYNDFCSHRDTLELPLEKVLIPNLITANNDTKNDCFAITGITKGWTVEIYNRWGDRVYKKEDYTNEWCGEGLSDGVYYYLVTTPRGVYCKGWVHIIR